MELKSITIEGMHNVQNRTYTFNNFNYLHGKNGAGKSTVLQAVQLALLGYIPGINKTKESIFSNANNHTMAVTAKLNDGTNNVSIRRVWTKNGKGITSTVSIQPEGYDIEGLLKDLELPIFNFSDFIGMTANKLKDWFISFLPVADKHIDWKTKLREAVGELEILDDTLIPSTISMIESFHAEGVEEVRKLNEYLKSMLSVKKAEADRCQTTIQSLIYYDDCVGDEDINTLKQELSDIHKKRDSEIEIRAIVANNDSVQQSLDMYAGLANTISDDLKYQDAMKCVDQCNAEIVKENDISAKLKQEISAIDTAIRSKNAIISSSGICSYTGQVCDSIVDKINVLKEEVDQLQAQISSKSSELNAIANRVKCAEIKLHNATQVISDLTTQYRYRDMMRNKLIIVPETERFDIEALNKQAQDTQDRIVKLEANRRYNNLVDKLTAEKFMVEQTVEIIKTWIKLTDVNGLQTTMMTAPFESLASKLDNYIIKFFGQGVNTRFNLSNKTNSFSFGICRGDSYIPFNLLSSGEKCLYTLALMNCIVSESESPLKLIMVDDLLDHLDTQNIELLFESLYMIEDIQFILAGVQKCTLTDADKVVIDVENIGG